MPHKAKTTGDLSALRSKLRVKHDVFQAFFKRSSAVLTENVAHPSNKAKSHSDDDKTNLLEWRLQHDVDADREEDT